jgi:replicative DNA helicase
MAEPLPHSDEAEQSVLGAVLQDNAALVEVGALLEPADFYHPAHAAIWRTITQLSLAGRRADVVTVFEAGQHDRAYLDALEMSVPSARHAGEYAQIVRQHSVRRQAVAVARALAEDVQRTGQNAKPATEVIDAAVVRLLELLQRGAPSEPRDLDKCTVEFLNDLEARASGKTDSISTGLLDLDRMTGEGGRPGELWVIGARPSMGKTALVLTLGRNVGRTHRVLMLTQEDSLLMMTARHVAAAGELNLADLRSPMKAPASMWSGVADAVEVLRPLQISMDDQAALTLADVRRKAQQVMARHGRVDMLVIDYLQLMDGDGGENRNRELGVISNGLKRLAKELRCWVVLLSQLNREADKRKPIMSDLRDSGDIEGAADLIGLLYREHRYKPTDDNRFYAELELVKQKNGATGTCGLFFDGATQRFANWDGPAPTSRGL